ncbi:MAG TPA: nucleoside monophosphate kinase [Spirochaetia bacterium]|nr:nucleoside monophosphate kinase [Spirochaetia bacterium]
MSHINFLFINGKGSSGKDTQADILLKNLGDKAIKLSTGDIYRDAKTGTGEYGRYYSDFAPFIDHVEKQGGYFPDDVMINVVGQIISEKMAEGYENFIFTGFPRTIGQMELMDELVSHLENASSVHLYFDISDETSKSRAEYRRRLAETNNVPIRQDDEKCVVEKRLNSFKTLTLPMLNKLENQNRLIKIKAEGTIQDIEKETSILVSKERI